MAIKTFVLRLIRQTDGYQLLPYTLAGGVVTVIVINVDRVAEGLYRSADLLRLVAGRIDFFW